MMFDETMQPIMSKNYVELNANKCVVSGWNDTQQPWRLALVPDAVFIGEFEGEAFRLFADGEGNPMLCDGEDRTPLYKLENDMIVRRTEGEIEAERSSIIRVEEMPSQLDKIEAQVAYTAMMTDTLLEV